MYRFLIWSLIIFLVWRWILKPLLKLMVVKSAQKMAQNMQQQYNKQQQPRYPEGSIHVDHIPNGNGQKNDGQASKY